MSKMVKDRSLVRDWIFDLRIVSTLAMMAAFLTALGIWAFDPPPFVSTATLVISGLALCGLSASHLGEGTSRGFELRHDLPVTYRERPVAFVLLFLVWALLLVWGIFMTVGSLIPSPGAA